MNCPLCTNHTANFLRIANRDYFDCPVCGACFMRRENLPPAKISRSRYLSHSNTISDAGYVRFLSSVIPFLKQFCPAALEVLDFGCGYAPVLVELLQQAGFSAVGYDPFFFPELSDDLKFDAVVSVETFEHFFQPLAELTRIGEWLKPQGILIIKTQMLQPQMDFREWWYVRDFTHTFFYRIQTFEWIAQNLDWRLLFSDQREHVVFMKK